MFAPRFSPASRGSLLLAAIPLATMVIHRAMLQLEDLIAERVQVLTSLETRIAAREAALGVLARYAPAEGPKTPEKPAEPMCGALHPVPGTDCCARERDHDGPHVGSEVIWWDPVDVAAADPGDGPTTWPGCCECGAPATGRWPWSDGANAAPYCAEHWPTTVDAQ